MPDNKEVPVYIRQDKTGKNIQVGWASEQVDGVRSISIFPEYKGVVNLIYGDERQDVNVSVYTGTVSEVVSNDSVLDNAVPENNAGTDFLPEPNASPIHNVYSETVPLSELISGSQSVNALLTDDVRPEELDITGATDEEAAAEQ